MRSHLRSSRRELQGRSPPIESYEAPQGRLRGAREGFSPSGFPPQWRTSVPHITLAFIPTAGGAAPAAAAQPPIETARGGEVAQVSKGSTEGGLARVRAVQSLRV